jgi:hypothetical protein
VIHSWGSKASYGDNFPNGQVSDFDYIREIRRLTEQPSYGWTRTLFVADHARGSVPIASSHQLRVDVKRNHLERELLQLRTQRRASELRTWDDVVLLRKDLREAQAEYQRVARLDLDEQ